MADRGIWRLVYCSRCTITGPEIVIQAQIVRIMASATRNNQRLGVCGALMLNAGWFTQVLEGPRDGVELLFDRLRPDPRHAEVTLVTASAEGARAVPARPMAFVGGSPRGAALFARAARAPDLSPAALDGGRLLAVMGDLIEADDRPPQLAR